MLPALETSGCGEGGVGGITYDSYWFTKMQTERMNELQNNTFLMYYSRGLQSMNKDNLRQFLFKYLNDTDMMALMIIK